MMAAIIKPSSGGHWYGIGEAIGTGHFARPEYDKNLRHARKEMLLPSVTTIDKIMANYQLTAWKQEQLLLAALTLPAKEGETSDDRIKRIIEDAEKHSKEAAEKGDIFHALMERYAKGQSIDITAYDEWIQKGFEKVTGWMKEQGCMPQYVEQGFACVDYGYACRIDWAGVCGGWPALIDYKTQGTKPNRAVVFYDSNARQLAANAMAIPHEIKRHINIVISTTEPGRVEIKEWSDEDIKHGWKMFYHLLNLFMLSKNLEWDAEGRRYV